MLINYTSKEIDHLLKTLPPSILDALLSEESANTIKRICQRNELGEEESSFTAETTGSVLLGLLNPNQLKNELAKKVGKEKAERLAQEIIRFILFPIKEDLSHFYREIEITPGGKLLNKNEGDFLSAQQAEKNKGSAEDSLQETENEGPDPYRENVDL